MEQFQIYRNGHYDHIANIKMKLTDKAKVIQQLLIEVDYYFAHHKKMVK